MSLKSPRTEFQTTVNGLPKIQKPPTCKWLHISKLLDVPYDSVKTAPSYVEALPHSEGRNRTCPKKSPKINFQTTLNGLPKILRGLPTSKWLHISKLLYVPYNPVKTAPSNLEALPHSEGRNRTCPPPKSPEIETAVCYANYSVTVFRVRLNTIT